MEQLLEKVRLLHIQNDFKNNGGEDKYFRMALLMEELGEICDALTCLLYTSPSPRDCS